MLFRNSVFDLNISPISKLLSEQDYDACIDEFECVVDFLETLEEDDDVQNVYSNVNLGGI